MRRWMAAPVLFAAAVALAVLGESRPVLGQDKPVEENFTTADGVRLRGLFHKAGKAAAGNPVVILLYPPGAGNDMNKPGDWAGLTKTLTDKGFHVFRFDWRGHGKSTDITDPNEFWHNPFTGAWNRKNVAGGAPRYTKNTISAKTDIRNNNSYLPVYVTDLAAARMHLDGKNDQGDLNTSSIYLIGAGDTATIGTMWMAAEWVRPAIHPTLGGGLTYKYTPFPGIIVDPEAGRDIAGAIWLTGTRAPATRERTVAGWMTLAPKLRENNPMLFLYGAKDAAGKRQGQFFFEEVLVARGNRALQVKALDQTFLTEVPNTNLKGAALLGNNAMLGTEDTIIKYLEARQKDRVSIVRKERKYVGPYYINLQYFGLLP